MRSVPAASYAPALVTGAERTHENERLAAIVFGRLWCVECDGWIVGHAPGWRAYLADDPRDDEAAEVAVYCPACGERVWLLTL
jgi:hypothetical protein